MRYLGAGMSCAGLLLIAAWGALAGSQSAVLGGLEVPIGGLWAIIAGLFVWMWGMARAERAAEAEWMPMYRASRAGR